QLSPATFDVVQLTTSGQAFAPIISPDGQQVAYTLRQCGDDGSCKSDIVVREIASGVERPIVADLPFAAPMQWSPSGLWMVISAEDDKGNEGTFSVSRLGGPLTFLGLGAAAYLPNGDTVLQASAFHVSKLMYLRRVPVSGQPTDSVAIAPPQSAQGLQSMSVSPSNRWIAVAWRTAAPQGVLALYDRAGKIADTVSVPQNAFPIWAPQSGAILTSIVSRRNEGALVRIAVDPATGRFSRKDTIAIAPGILQPDFDIPPSGRSMVYAAARRGESEMWTLSRDRAGTVPHTLRRVRAASEEFGFYLSRDGRQIIFSATDRTQGQARQQYFVTGFDSGAARPLTPALADVIDQNPTLDFRSLVVATRDSPHHSQLTAYDVATGKSTHFADEASDQFVVIEGGMDGIAVIKYRTDSLRVLDGRGHELRRIGIPDSLGQVFNFLASPDGRELGLATIPRTDPALASQWIMSLYRMSLTTGQVRLVSRVPIEETPRWLRWSDDGWIHIDLVTPSDRRNMLYRVRADGGPVELENALPFPRGSQCDISGDGKRWVCEVTHQISDLYVIRNFQAR
ncbi:MAG: hypothetical protein ACREND_07875, partial [Gemmatimonadaceae bacterium]